MGVPLPSQDSGIDLVAVKHDGHASRFSTTRYATRTYRHQPAPGRATHAAVCARVPAELGTPSSESPLENRGVKLVRLNGHPQTAFPGP